MKSRAAVMVMPGVIEVREYDVPSKPPPGGAVVRIVANGLCGVDVEIHQQRIPAGRLKYPFIPGHEMVGEIVMIDPIAAEDWRVNVGDRVAIEAVVACGRCSDCLAARSRFCKRAFRYSLESVDREPGLWGGMAEYMVLVAGTRVTPVPPHVSDDDAGLFNIFANCFEMAARVGGVRVGDRVLILGAGQRGLGCAVVAREAGAAEIIVTGLERDHHKMAMAPDFGATGTINVEREETVERVMELTRGEGVDLVIDTVPSDTDPILHALAVLRPEGTLVLSGVKGREVTGLNPDVIFMKALTIKGSFNHTAWATGNAMRIISSGRYPFHKFQSHSFDLDNVERAIGVLSGDVTDTVPPFHITIKP